jgi:hypothetical protein
MKIIKYSLMLGVASAFLLNSNLFADDQADTGVAEPQIGSLFDDVREDGSITPFDAKPEVAAEGKKRERKKLTDEEKQARAEKMQAQKDASAARKAAKAKKKEDKKARRAANIKDKANGVVAEENLDTSINDNVVELPKVDIDNALAALEQAKAALEDTQAKAAENDAAKQAEAAAEEQKAKDAAELERLRSVTPEDHRAAAEDHVLKQNQHLHATALVTTDDGVVKVKETGEVKANVDQAAQLKEMGVGNGITAELLEPAAPIAAETEPNDTAESEGAVAAPEANAASDSTPEAGDEVKAADAGSEPNDAAASEGTVAEPEANADAKVVEGKKAKKPRKKPDEKGKKAHEEKMQKQKEDKESKKAADKAFREGEKAKQIAEGNEKREKRQKKKAIAAKKEAGEAKRKEREERKEENKNKDYTALLNESDTPAGEAN